MFSLERILTSWRRHAARTLTSLLVAHSTSMSSINSGSVVAIGKEILAGHSDALLPTYSGAQPKGRDCAESRAVYAAASMSNITPAIVHPDDLRGCFETYLSGLDEPFDGEFSILNAMYRRASEDGRRVLLDGAGGDVVLAEGSYFVRLIRRGQLALAWREIEGFQTFCEDDFSPLDAVPYLRAALTPEAIKKPWRPLRYRSWERQALGASLIDPEFARAINMEARFATYCETNTGGWTADYAAERCATIRPSMTAGRERYARLAALSGIERAWKRTAGRRSEFTGPSAASWTSLPRSSKRPASTSYSFS